MHIPKLALIIAVAAAFAGCANPHAASGSHELQPPADAEKSKSLAEVDWNKADVVRIELRDYGFAPRELRLRTGRPYRLEIFNSGGNTHYFNAPEFFQSVATHKAEVRSQAEIKANSFTQFEIMRRGGQLDFYFVPLVAGTYRVHCHLENHAQMGVEGLLIVE
jgi:uncharacterized cupredoxin-like copper-binding protein